MWVSFETFWHCERALWNQYISSEYRENSFYFHQMFSVSILVLLDIFINSYASAADSSTEVPKSPLYSRLRRMAALIPGLRIRLL